MSYFVSILLEISSILEFAVLTTEEGKARRAVSSASRNMAGDGSIRSISPMSSISPATDCICLSSLTMRAPSRQPMSIILTGLMNRGMERAQQVTKHSPEVWMAGTVENWTKGSGSEEATSGMASLPSCRSRKLVMKALEKYHPSSPVAPATNHFCPSSFHPLSTKIGAHIPLNLGMNCKLKMIYQNANEIYRTIVRSIIVFRP